VTLSRDSLATRLRNRPSKESLIVLRYVVYKSCYGDERKGPDKKSRPVFVVNIELLHFETVMRLRNVFIIRGRWQAQCEGDEVG